MRPSIPLAQFAGLGRRPGAEPICVRSDGGAPDLANSNGRLISYVFSDPSVARDDHVIAANAWDLSNFLRNPVFLWAHDSDSPPIGRVVDIGTLGGQLRGTVEYVERDIYPFADTIFQLTKAGYINATSTSWLPIEYRFSTDKARPGGIDFSKVDLLEISQVPVPALPTALVTARARGIDTGPIFEWAERMLDASTLAVLPRTELELLRKEARMPTGRHKRAETANWTCGAARDLSIDDKTAWDGAAAAARMLDAATDGDTIDAAKAARGFLLYDAANPDLRTSYKEPFADLVDGKLVAVAGGLAAAASRLPDLDGPSDDVKAEARKVLDAYEAKAKEDAGKRRLLGAGKRGLGNVSYLAMILGDLGYLQDWTEYESACEGDDSPIPAQLLEAMKALGAVLIAMTIEEVGELLSDGDDEDSSEVDIVTMASGSGLKRDAFRLLRRLDDGAMAAIASAMSLHLGGRKVTFKIQDGAETPIKRAGKVLSTANERCLREALDLHDRACGMVRSVVDQAGTEDDPDDNEDGDDEERAFRERKARALKLSLGKP